MSVVFTAEYPAVPKGIKLVAEYPMYGDAAEVDEFIAQVEAVNLRSICRWRRLLIWFRKGRA